jgi:glutamyl-tRNA reductase
MGQPLRISSNKSSYLAAVHAARRSRPSIRSVEETIGFLEVNALKWQALAAEQSGRQAMLSNRRANRCRDLAARLKFEIAALSKRPSDAKEC